MCNCKFKQFERVEGITKILEYSISDVEELKKRWREINSTEKIIAIRGRDIPYEKYCNELDEFFKNCKCKMQIERLAIEEPRPRMNVSEE